MKPRCVWCRDKLNEKEPYLKDMGVHKACLPKLLNPVSLPVQPRKRKQHER